MKICLCCKKDLDEGFFSKRRTTKDGLRTWCKQCEVDANLKYRKTTNGKAALDAYRKKPEVRVKAREAVSRWVQSDGGRMKKREVESRYPGRIKARHAVSYAVLRGRLIPWPVCAVPECDCVPEAHHPDYSQPLDVVWLCDTHHKAAHKIAIPF